MRVNPGINTCCGFVDIDVKALCQFQSSYRKPAKPFKPVPDGFEIDFGLKVLPPGEKE